jgi:hypothetical protein
MTRQTAQPLHRWSFQPSARSAHEIAGTLYVQLDLNPPYQRGHVWTEDQRVALVKSWIMGLAIPAVVLNDRCNQAWASANGSVFDSEKVDGNWLLWAVVDGKQRIETARQWFTGQLAVPASWFESEWVETTTETEDGPYVDYYGLSDVGARFTNRDFQLGVIETSLGTVREEAEMYLLVNGGGTLQTQADLDNAAEVAGR